MMSTTVRSASALLGATFVSVALGAQPAHAQACPCFMGQQLDDWFQTTQLAAGAPPRVHLCVDDPGFITLDFLERKEPGVPGPPSALYADVTFATSFTPGRCVVETRPDSAILADSGVVELSAQQAQLCRRQIIVSQAWDALGCPNN